jgi:hypothetical protein
MFVLRIKYITVIFRNVLNQYYSLLFIIIITVKSVFSGHPGNPKIVAEEVNGPFRRDCFCRECVVEGKKQTGRIRQMAV